MQFNVSKGFTERFACISRGLGTLSFKKQRFRLDETCIHMWEQPPQGERVGGQARDMWHTRLLHVLCGKRVKTQVKA